MRPALIRTSLLSLILGLSACSKEEPEGTAEKMGKKIDEAAEAVQKKTLAAVEATEKQATETKAKLGAAMEEMGKQLREAAEKSSQ